MKKPDRGFWLRLLISLAALAGLLYMLRGKLGEAFGLLGQGLAWEWFLIATIIYFAALAVISWRLQMIFRVQAVKIRFAQVFYLSFLSLFFNLFFPSALGGDVAKGYFAYQYSGKKLGSLTGVLLDRLMGFVTLILIALIALGFYSHQADLPAVKPSIYGAVGVLILGTLFFANKNFAKKFQILSFLVPSAEWREKLSALYHAIREYRNHRTVLFASLGLSVVAQTCFIVSMYFLSQSLSAPISLWPFFLLMPLVALVSMAPSLSGLGVREIGFVFFFKSFIPAEQAFALTLLFDVLFYGSAVAAGLVFAFKGGLKREVIHDLKAVEALQEVPGGGT